MNWSIRKQMVQWGFVGAMITLTTIGGLMSFEVFRLIHSYKLVGQIHDLTDRLYEADTLIDNASLGVHSFLLTRRPDNLAPYERAKEAIPVKSSQIHALLRAGPFPENLFDSYEALMKQQMAFFAALIEEVHRRGIPQALRMLETGEAREWDAQNDAMARNMRELAVTAVENREAKQRRALRHALIGSAAAGVASVLLLLLVYYLLQQEIGQRERLQSALECSLVQSEKMAQIGQFAAGVAHDVNNPIGVILGFAQALLRRAADSDPLAMPYKSIEREALRCKALVQNLLSFARGEGQKPSMKPADLSDVIAGALTLVATLARSKQVLLVVPPPEPLPQIVVDANQIQQLVINLCTNAMDAMPGGGTLTVTLAESAGGIEIAVTDTGTGIPPEVRDRMFDAFFTTKAAGKGTGLGLSIVSTIVKTHEGKIDCDSRAGLGTTFRVHLPLPIAARSQPAAVHQLAA